MKYRILNLTLQFIMTFSLVSVTQAVPLDWHLFKKMKEERELKKQMSTWSNDQWNIYDQVQTLKTLSSLSIDQFLKEARIYVRGEQMIVYYKSVFFELKNKALIPMTIETSKGRIKDGSAHVFVTNESGQTLQINFDVKSDGLRVNEAIFDLVSQVPEEVRNELHLRPFRSTQKFVTAKVFDESKDFYLVTEDTHKIGPEKKYYLYFVKSDGSYYEIEHDSVEFNRINGLIMKQGRHTVFMSHDWNEHLFESWHPEQNRFLRAYRKIRLADFEKSLPVELLSKFDDKSLSGVRCEALF